MMTYKIISALSREELLNALLLADPHAVITAERTPSRATAQKVALWCALYKLSYAEDYSVTKVEAGLLRSVPINNDLVVHFFNSPEWWAKTKTIATYVKRINEIKLALAGKDGAAAQQSGRSLAEAFSRRFSK